jgi:hypothetical protein
MKRQSLLIYLKVSKIWGGNLSKRLRCIQLATGPKDSFGATGNKQISLLIEAPE